MRSRRRAVCNRVTSGGRWLVGHQGIRRVKRSGTRAMMARTDSDARRPSAEPRRRVVVDDGVGRLGWHAGVLERVL